MVIVEKVREKAVSVEKVYGTPRCLSEIACLLKGIATSVLSISN